ncbi:outer membrane protein assembly factor BamB [Oceanobacter sp. 3_MG-2023]|uniref:outer membrane protein assembly factor BamB n=1 Tax=Oceanobacter sp. 3_MG-2023 TaxID=3062622 RepID=UPI002736DE4F|nr:outer membrane protein assembly factor BamB [Oceanobacter sp. 3_MG-2023]MDP2506770.1 outer membrane protein assembly factor BamB [Oceanobacter sp. 3_MG-2023]
MLSGLKFGRQRLVAGRVTRTGLLLAAVLVSACSSQPQTDAESLPSLGSNGLDIVWRTHIGDGPGSNYSRLQAVAADDVLYAADTSGSVWSLALDSGRTLWQQTLEKPVSAGVTLAGEHLFLVTVDGVLHSLTADQGQPVWQAQLSSEAVAAAEVDDERVYVHTIDGRVSAFDRYSGEQRWSYETAMPILSVRGTAAPVVSGELVILGLANGKVIALDRRLGIPRWDVRLATPEGRSELERLVDADGTVVVENQLIYAASYHGKVAAISATGETRWEEDGSSYTSPVLSLGNVYLTLDDSSIRAFDVYGGDPVWTQGSLKGRQLGGVEAYQNNLFVTDSEGFLYLLSQVDGALLARLSLIPNALHVSYPNQSEATRWRQLHGRDFGVRSPLLVTDRGVVVYTNAGDVMLVTAEE